MKVVKMKNAPEKPNRKKVTKVSRPDNNSTSGYRNDILDLQLPHLPFSKIQEKIGIL